MQDIKTYNYLVQKLRTFFLDKGFIEVPAQSRLSILAACEDPFTISEFTFSNQLWPLPQTGQMWLEHELLKNPELLGVFCITTSYRNEPNPIPGRHDLIFPMFEFESRGDFKDLLSLEDSLCEYLGFQIPPKVTYKELQDKYGVEILENHHETQMYHEYGNSVTLTKFPEVTEPFWNMKSNNDGTYNKADVIMGGMETIGSAEREIHAVKMISRFKEVSQGKYAGKLHSLFGMPRVQKELEEYLSFEFFPRFGGGIGITRLAHALKLLNKNKSGE